MEKLLVTSNFSFSYSVFKRLVLQTRQNQGLSVKGLNVAEMTIFLLVKSIKQCGKWKKYWLPALSPFSTMFCKVFSLRVVKNRDCVDCQSAIFGNSDHIPRKIPVFCDRAVEIERSVIYKLILQLFT